MSLLKEWSSNEKVYLMSHVPTEWSDWGPSTMYFVNVNRKVEPYAFAVLTE